ncbi:MAG TPA: hypothetical protein VH115_02780 [Solirubrobacteraceae bacterium]|nr:hypothetical protein [Solirubrobacteraceae bacterium]
MSTFDASEEKVIGALAHTRSLFKADAGFEAVFGSMLLAGATAGFLTGGDIPVARTVILWSGIAFLIASASQLAYFINARRRVLLELAVGNAAMGAAGAIWLALDRGFSLPGAALVAAAIAWKLAIGVLQTRSLERSTTSS